MGALAAISVSGAADAQMTMRGTSGEGRRIFHSPVISSNGLSCFSCHSDFDEGRHSDGLIRAGHSLANSAGRKTWWGQEPDDADLYPDIAHASVVCVERSMRNPEKLTAQQLLSLQAYLLSITRQRVQSPLAIAPAADKTGVYAGFGGGDKIRGRDVFYAACHSCHPNGGSGIAPAIPRGKEPPFYARKVREGDGIGAKLSAVDPDAYDPDAGLFMPYFGADRLTNKDLRDIIAYVRGLPPP